MRYAPAATAALAFVISLSAACLDGKPTYNDFHVWSGDGLKTLSSVGRFQPAADGLIMWDIVNSSESYVVASVRVTHCNGSVDITPATCPFTVAGSSSCQINTTFQVPPYGEAVAGQITHLVREDAQCRVPFTENPFEWLIDRHRWHVSLDAVATDGSTAAFDPELQIDRGKGFNLLVNALLVAAGMGALHVLARQLRRLLGL